MYAQFNGINVKMEKRPFSSILFIRLKWLSLTIFLGLGLLGTGMLVLFHVDPVQAVGVTCVVPPGDPTGPFSPCSQVYNNIQSAVNAAAPGDEIWMAAGHYTDIYTSPYGFWNQVLFVQKTLTIRGGFQPPFTSPPDPLAHPTILDAQGQATTVYLLTPEANLTGLHITGGAPHGLRIEYGEAISISRSTIYNNFGGGVVVAYGTAVFNDNIIRNNHGLEQGGNHTGGGLAILSSQVALDSNYIISNVALSHTLNYGDGAYGGGLWAQESVITLTNNIIMSNTAVLSGTSTTPNPPAGFGGGLALLNSQVYANGNDVSHNTAMRWGAEGRGGGLYSHNNLKLHLVGNTFSDNVACDYCGNAFGGGLYVDVDYSTAVTPVIILENNLIQDNIAAMIADEGDGGGLSFWGDFDHYLPLSLHNNIVIRNTALVSGGVGLGGGLTLANVQANLSGNQILSNTAAVSAQYISFAGGLFMGGGHASLDGDSITNNMALSGNEALGGGIGLNYGDLTMTNTVILNNKARNGAALSTYSGPGHLSLIHNTIANNQSSNGAALFIKDELTNGSHEPFSLAITNTIITSHSIGILLTGTHTVMANGLLWYNTSTPISATIMTTLSLTHQYFGNPHFDIDGHHLLPKSAAIGRGVIIDPIHDIDGEPRRTPPDLGADEFWSDKLYLPVIWNDP